MILQKIKIFSVDNGAPVEALFYDELKDEHFVSAEASWAPERLSGLKRLLAEGVSKDKLPQHFHWNWASKASRLSLLAYRGFGIECKGLWQGLMLTVTEGHVAKLSPDAGKSLVYIDFIETAPWNVVPLAKVAKYRGIGLQLFEAAVRQSVAEGFHGRVGLHALRDAEDFYQKRGMIALGPDTAYQNLQYYELSMAAAQAFLSRS